MVWSGRLTRRALAVCCLWLMTAPLWAAVTAVDDPSRVVPRDLRPDSSRAPAPVELTPQAPVAELPPDVASLSVLVGQVQVRDGFAELAPATAQLLTPFAGQRHTVSELNRLAAAIEALYQQAGYFLVRVTIPPQEVRDGGDFFLQVVDGYLEAVNVDGIPARLHRHVRAFLQPLLQQRQLKRSELERALLLAGRTPGLPLRSTLAAGSATGSTVLVLEGNYARFGGSLGVDNHLSDTLGPWKFTWQQQVNQPLRLGEQWYFYLSDRPNTVLFDTERTRRALGGGITLPLGHKGLSLNLEATESRTWSHSLFFFIPDTSSHFKRGVVRLSYPLWLTRAGELSTSLALEAIEQTNVVPAFNDFELSRDELRIVRLAFSGNRRLSPQTSGSFSVQLSQGLSWDARDENDVVATGIPFGRIGSVPDFTRLEVSLGAQVAVASSVSLVSSLRAQRAFDALPGSEMFGLDGPGSLSALDSGSVAGDHGWSLREELVKYVQPYGRTSLSPYAYLAVGKATSKLGAADVMAQAVGVGVRGRVGAFDFDFEYGHGRIDTDRSPHWSDNRLSVSLRGNY